MAYDGEYLNSCGEFNLDFSQAYAIVVSGDGPNFCGHMLLNVGGRSGHYFHVASFHDYPKHMNDTGYRRYLSELNKRELGRYRIQVPNPNESILYLEHLASAKWTWMVVPNNCVHFVEEVFQAGGANFGLYSNCPQMQVEGENVQNLRRSISRELTDDSIQRRIFQFMEAASGGNY